MPTPSRSPFVRAARPDPVRIAAIKDLVFEALALGPEITVLVQELACREPGCPPVETVIAVFEPAGRTRRWTLHDRVSGLDERTVHAALAAAPGLVTS